MPDIYETIGGKLLLLIFTFSFISGVWSSSIEFSFERKKKLIISIGWKFGLSFLGAHLTLSTFNIIDPWDPDLAVLTSIVIGLPISIVLVIWQIKDFENEREGQ